MKLLLDENLSYKLEARLQDIFPGSRHVRSLSLEHADDDAIWQYAKDGGYVIATQDSDFGDRATLYGSPPCVIWIRCGNSSVTKIEQLLRKHSIKLHHLVDAGQGDQAIIEIDG